jgi:hypothetical protein
MGVAAAAAIAAVSFAHYLGYGRLDGFFYATWVRSRRCTFEDFVFIDFGHCQKPSAERSCTTRVDGQKERSNSNESHGRTAEGAEGTSSSRRYATSSLCAQLKEVVDFLAKADVRTIVIDYVLCRCLLTADQTESYCRPSKCDTKTPSALRGLVKSLRPVAARTVVGLKLAEDPETLEIRGSLHSHPALQCIGGRKNKLGNGFINIFSHPLDGDKRYTYSLAREHNGRPRFSLAAWAAARATKRGARPSISDDVLVIGERSVPLRADYTQHLVFGVPPVDDTDWRATGQVSIGRGQIHLAPHLLEKISNKGFAELQRKQLTGKIVIIGNVLWSPREDERIFVQSSGRRVLGPRVHAALIETLLHGRFGKSIGFALSVVALLPLCLASLLLWYRLKPRFALLGSAGITLAYLSGAFGLAHISSHELPLVGYFFALLLASVGGLLSVRGAVARWIRDWKADPRADRAHIDDPKPHAAKNNPTTDGRLSPSETMKTAFPRVLSCSYFRLKNARTPHKRLQTSLELFESTLWYVGAVVLADHENCGKPTPKARDLVLPGPNGMRMERPSIGVWWDTVRLLPRYYNPDPTSGSRPPMVPELYRLARHHDIDSLIPEQQMEWWEERLETVRKTRKQSKADAKLVRQGVAMRNKVSHKLLGSLDDIEIAKLADRLESFAHAILFDHFAFLADYRLILPIHAEHVFSSPPSSASPHSTVPSPERSSSPDAQTTSAAHCRYTVVDVCGLVDETRTVTTKTKLAAYTPYLCVPQDPSSRDWSNTRFLSLSPYIQITYCDYHHEKEMFVYGDGLFRGKTITYVGPSLSCSGPKPEAESNPSVLRVREFWND